MSYDEHLISMAGGDGELDLDAIQARADAATEGPWKAAVYEYGMQDGRIRVTSPSDSGIYNLAEDVLPDDAEFIAHARTDVPALLAVVRSQQAVIAKLSDWAGRSRTGYYDEAQDDVVQIIRAALTATEGA